MLRLVGDLAGNRMLDELPVDAFTPLRRARTRGLPLPRRLGAGMLGAVTGRRMVLADPDRLAGWVYRAGGRLLFTPVAAVLLAGVILAGMALFVATWLGGAQSIFLVGDSYLLGALALLGLNVVALAAHEAGHALAATHAGRRVPAAGVLLYFGLPSVFVDTTDAWMAGRRDRLRISLAGPVAALTIAGLAQLVALAYPSLAPLAFKIAFVWYLNWLFNLNPLLALDGYYALMDWLEIPNLRPRAVATLVGWARRRRPRWSELDREGRLIAVYAVLAVLWLFVMVHLLVRLYRERVAGVVTGLWQLGPAARLLLVAVAVGLVLPLVYAVAGWSAGRWRRLGAWRRERRRERDLPRRVRALSGSELGDLPPPELAALAANARWLRPATGAQVLAAGAAPGGVLLVVDGTLEGRAPGDPPGSVRERAGAGELVGTSAVLSAGPSALSWTAAGTTLLAIPGQAYRSVVGPLTAPVAGDPAEAHALLAESPALTGLSGDEREGLAAQMRALALLPGQPVEVTGPDEAVLVAAGTLVRDGHEVRRGELIGPAGEGETVRAQARTAVRAWVVPVLAGLATGLAAGRTTLAAQASALPRPTVGLHSPGGYPPLAARPGPPPAGDDRTDRRLLGGMGVLVLLLLLLLAMCTGPVAVAQPPPWTEMPRDRVLLSVERGPVVAVIEGHHTDLRRGDRGHLRAGDRVETGPDARGLLTFFGGGEVLVCARSEVGVDRLAGRGQRPVRPAGTLTLVAGAVVADTTPATATVDHLLLTVGVGQHEVASHGPARFTATTGTAGPVAVAAGQVGLDGRPQPLSGRHGCPGGPGAGAAPTPDESPGPTGSPTAGPTPVATASPTPTPSPTPSPGPTKGPTAGPTLPPPPPPNAPPQILATDADPRAIQQVCPRDDSDVATVSIISALVTDADHPADALVVTFHYALDGADPPVTGTVAMMHQGGDVFEGPLGPFPGGRGQPGGGFLVHVTATDPAGAQATSGPLTVRLLTC